ncbi:MAG: hypothetical protein ACI7YS_18140 [Flavobacterium sp.]
MRKTLLLLAFSLTLFSCGRDKKKETVSEKSETVNKYAVILDAIYEKEDSISVIYKTDGYFQWEKPVSQLIKGSPELQRITVNIPDGIDVENFQITCSTNKGQKMLTIKNISIKNGDVEVFNGDNLNYGTYFNANPGFIWNQTGLNYILNFDGQYPPGQTGNEKLEAILESK